MIQQKKRVSQVMCRPFCIHKNSTRQLPCFSRPERWRVRWYHTFSFRAHKAKIAISAPAGSPLDHCCPVLIITTMCSQSVVIYFRRRNFTPVYVGAG
jgi:hypothetical protein